MQEIVAITQEKENCNQTKGKIESLVPGSGVIRKAVKKAEEQSRACERLVKDILDEIGDCFHDDAIFRRRMLNEIFLRPETKKKIAYKFMSIIAQG